MNERSTLTILCTAAEQIENVVMATNHLHHFHLLDEVGQLAVGRIVLAQQPHELRCENSASEL